MKAKPKAPKKKPTPKTRNNLEAIFGPAIILLWRKSSSFAHQGALVRLQPFFPAILTVKKLSFSVIVIKKEAESVCSFPNFFSLLGIDWKKNNSMEKIMSNSR